MNDYIHRYTYIYICYIEYYVPRTYFQQTTTWCFLSGVGVYVWMQSFALYLFDIFHPQDYVSTYQSLPTCVGASASQLENGLLRAVIYMQYTSKYHHIWYVHTYMSIYNILFHSFIYMHICNCIYLAFISQTSTTTLYTQKVARCCF